MIPLNPELKGPLSRTLFVAGLLSLAFALIWINRYEYHQVGVRLVRINRFTGQGCYLWGNGTWNSQAFPESKATDQKETSIFDAFDAKAENKCQ